MSCGSNKKTEVLALQSNLPVLMCVSDGNANHPGQQEKK